MKNPEFEKWQETLAQELKVRDIRESIAFLHNWEPYFNCHYTATQVADLIEDNVNDIF